MLIQLSISNYALIDSIEIDFNKGFSIITGETGAGKSIMLGALSLILGERADPKSIRNGEKKSVIEAVFDLRGYELEPLFLSYDIEYDTEHCILRRELLPNGRSRAFINDTPVNLGQLHELSENLIDIHSQQSNQLLTKPQYQLNIIDSIANNSELLRIYSETYDEYKKAKAELSEAIEKNAQNRSNEEYIKFQLSQLSELKLRDGEEAELENKQATLSNMAEIKTGLWEIYALIGESDDAVLSRLHNISIKLNSLSRILPEAGELKERIDSTIIEIKDIYATVNSVQSDLSDNPDELEKINERLNRIYTLKKKHNLDTVKDLIELRNHYETIIMEIGNSEHDIAELEKNVTEKLEKVLKLAGQLSVKRKEAAGKFAERLKKSAIPLGMKNLQCEIQFSETQPGNRGTDNVRFMFAFNKNQPMLPVENNASGGEISRMMLCIKTIIAESMQLPTIIFDEIDTGVSGDIASKMGEMMQNIGQKLQVISITHLPQVAASGEYHYKVYKKDKNDSTYTYVKELSSEERINEIAGMLSGRQINEAAINNAKSLLDLKHK